MSCSCDHALFLQNKERKTFYYMLQRSLLGHVRMLFFMEKNVFHNFFWLFSSTNWSRNQILLKSRETLSFISNVDISMDENINKITNKLQKLILIVLYVRQSSNLSFSLFNQRESFIVEDPMLHGGFLMHQGLYYSYSVTSLTPNKLNFSKNLNILMREPLEVIKSFWIRTTFIL
jgi:hypothetical protein